jgi:asparagine synthase (glutamine-hydrolysing)
MCGLVGEFASGGVAIEESLRRIDHLASLARRRGPDGNGLWSDHRNCTMGFRRLAVLDLSDAGQQPMVSRGGNHVLVFNGELYNFRELRRHLEQRGHVFRSTGDTEVALYSLVEWGIDALARFNAMFALAFYDVRERRLLLARDHAGIKPLYYLQTREGVCFASQYDQILGHPWSHPLAVSRAAMGQYLRFGYIPAPAAALEETHMVEPGTWVRVDARGQLSNGTYFRFPVSSEPSLRGEAANEAVDAAVAAAVRRQLVSDVPVAAFLSGGIDSPLVVAKAQETSSGLKAAYTVGTNGDALDESAEASDYARQLSLEHHVEHATPEKALSLIDEVVEAAAEPFADYSLFPTLMVSRSASRDVKVVLAGDGGDELFWGYTGRFGSVLRESPTFAQPFWLRTARRALRRATGPARWEPSLGIRSIGEWYAARHSRISGDWLEQLFPTMGANLQPPRFFDYSGRHENEVANWMRWNEFVGHLTMVLLKVDRGSMFSSLEVRVPLLDREVIEVATAVDWRSCLDLETGTGKLPLRASLARHVVRQTHGKKGFTVPMDHWMRTSLRPKFEEAVLSRKEIAGVETSPIELARMYRRHLNGDRFGWSLWVLLSLAMWEDRHLRGGRTPWSPALHPPARDPDLLARTSENRLFAT